MKKQDTYGEPRIIEFDNMIARVYSPILTEAERKQRLDAIAKAAASLLLSNDTKDLK